MLVTEQTTASQDESRILHPSSRTLFRFWEAMRAEKPALRRSDLDLSQIRALVPDLLIAAVDEASQTYRWRLAGTGICELYRSEMTGRNFLDGWDAFEADVIARFLAGVIHNQQPCLLRFRMHTDMNQIIGTELIGLPLLASDSRSIHIFGGLFPFREIWTLGYGKIKSIELSGARSIWTEHLPGDQLLAQTARGPAERRFRNFEVIPGNRK